MDIHKQMEVLDKHMNNVPLEFKPKGAQAWQTVSKNHVFNFHCDYREAVTEVHCYLFAYINAYGDKCSVSRFNYILKIEIVLLPRLNVFL